MYRLLHTRLPIFFAIVLLSFAAVDARATTYKVNCDVGNQTIQAKLNQARDGDTIEVRGTCRENIVISGDRIRLIAEAAGATILSAQVGERVVDIRGHGIELSGFTIKNGTNFGVVVLSGAAATIIGNVIEFNERGGILVSSASNATIRANIIQFNRNDVRPPAHGILVSNDSNATIVDNTIAYNDNDGVRVREASSARVNDNVITNNGGNGVLVRRTSSVHLSSPGPSPGRRPNDFDQNGGFAVSCELNSSVTSSAAQNFLTTPENQKTSIEETCVVEGNLPVDPGDPPPPEPEQFRIVRGTVNSNGTIADGTGFTVTPDPILFGIHTIQFDDPFSETPTPVATGIGAFDPLPFILEFDAQGIRIRLTNAFSNQGYTFIVIGKP